MDVQGSIRTLIVEDSIPTRRMLRARMETLGCTIVGEAENPTQGLKLFRELSPQVVTLDLVMPQVDEMDTEQLFKIIRAEKPDTSVIVISSSSKALTAAGYISQGAVAYLEKPFVNFDQLREKLEALYPHVAARRMSRTSAASSLLR
ncbi:MAG TPA: response regulator [Candidatus Binataceae bacterium]|nr:response regulator [Candidatus Binataceae bacterium]